MLIYLLRHGRAEDGFGMRDEDRALTEDGWERLQRAAPAWERLVEPLQVIYVSPLRRAQETASVLVGIVRGDPELKTDPALVPGGNIREALQRIGDEEAAGHRNIAFVGHEPHLGCLLGALLTGDEYRSIPLKKGMLVAVELESAASSVGELRFSLTQRAAAELE